MYLLPPTLFSCLQTDASNLKIPLKMKWFVGLFGTLLCAYVMLSCAVGSEEGEKSVTQLKTIPATTTSAKVGPFNPFTAEFLPQNAFF